MDKEQALPSLKPRRPVVAIRHSLRPDSLVCLDCGFRGKMIKRHLRSAHNMTPEQYRDRWKLPADYPMTAPDYSRQRSRLGKLTEHGPLPLGIFPVQPPQKQ